jgi:hypothetical protein
MAQEMQPLRALRWTLRAAVVGCFIVGLSGHYRGTHALIGSTFWQVFLLLFGSMLLVIDKMLQYPKLPELPLPFERNADEDSPTRLDV